MRTKLDSGHVSYANSPPIWRFAHDDVTELFRRSQAALSQHRVGELLTLLSWLSPDLTRRIHSVLGLKCVRNVRDGDTQLSHLVRLDPQPHGVLARAEHLGLADAVQASHGVVEVDVCVISQIVRIVGAIWRVQGNKHERSSGCLFKADPIIVHLGRQLTVGQLLARLREQQVRVGISFQVEIDEQGCLLVCCGVQRVHITHVVHTTDLLLNGCSNCLLEGLCICTGIGGLQSDLGRSDLRELGYWQGRD